HLPRIQTMTAFHLLVHPLQLEELRVDAVDPDQRMLPDRCLDRGIRIRTCLLELPPLVDAPLDEDGQHRGTDRPLIEAGDLVEEHPIAVRPAHPPPPAQLAPAQPPPPPHPQQPPPIPRPPAHPARPPLLPPPPQHAAPALPR